MSEKKKKEAFRIKGALSNAKQNKNTSNNSHIEEGQRKSPKMNQSNCKGAPLQNHSEKNRALQNAKNDNKTTKKKSSDRRMPS